MKASENLATMQSAGLARLDWRTMLTGETEKLTPEDAAAMDEYFKQFVQLDFDKDAKRECPCCHSSFGQDGITGFLMSGSPGHATLEWGLANGEAFCSRCKYPFRVYHRSVGPIKFLNIGLPYHPDELSVKA